MTPDVVVDIGNSRMKWGFCLAAQNLRPVSFSFDERDWEIVAGEFGFTHHPRWVVASVNPGVLVRFSDWARSRGDTVFVLERKHINLPVNVENPDQVGVDRLVNAIAARSKLSRQQAGIIISVGTAITVDLIDANGVFQGGAILPGPQLMLSSLHEHTAKLPLIHAQDLGQPHPGYDDHPPGKNTENAIVVGVIAAIKGAAQRLVAQLCDKVSSPVQVFITGGAAHHIRSTQFERVSAVKYVEGLTLEGIRIAAEALP